MRVALAQINPVLGDVYANLRQAEEAIEATKAEWADLVVLDHE